MSALLLTPLDTIHTASDYSGEATTTATDDIVMTSEYAKSREGPLSEERDVVMEESENATSDADMDGVSNANTSQSDNISHAGLRNLGNTCYMNSALQTLASLEGFANLIGSTDPTETDDGKLQFRKEFLKLMDLLKQGGSVNPEDLKKAIDDRIPLFVGYRQQDSHEFLTTLLDLLNEDFQPKSTPKAVEKSSSDDESKDEDPVSKDATSEESDDSKDMDESKDVMPTPLSELAVEDISTLLHGDSKEADTDNAKMPETNSKGGPVCKLVGGRAKPAEDANTLVQAQVSEHEVVQMVTADTSEAMGNDVDDEDDDDGVTKTTDSSPVDDYFLTEVRSRLTCESCKYSRSHVEKYYHLSLDIGNDSGSVEDGLRKFFASEKVEIKCEKCFGETACQTKEITRLPKALLLHFKRFIVDVSPDYTSITYRKNVSPVSFDAKISVKDNDDDTTGLGEFLADDVSLPTEPLSFLHAAGDDDHRQYHVRSIVNHIGSSASCGHYTADAHREYRDHARKWTRFNDSLVTRIGSDEALSAEAKKTAYMVLYELA